MFAEPEPRTELLPPKVMDAFHVAAEACDLTFLTGKKGANAFLALHRPVYWSLNASQRHFLKYLQYWQLVEHLKGGHHLLGLNTPDKTMVAQARVTFPELSGTSNLDGYPFGADLKPEDCAVVQSLGAHPKTNGMGGQYIKSIFDGVAGVADGEHCRYVIGKLSYGNDQDIMNNHRSFKTFERNGFHQLTEPAYVAQDKYKSIFMIRDLKAPSSVLS